VEYLLCRGSSACLFGHLAECYQGKRSQIPCYDPGAPYKVLGLPMSETPVLTGYSIILTCFITDAIKNAVGRPRPDLLARCKPASGTPKDVLVTIAVCTETDSHTLHDGWRSFPSGHSSFAFSGLGFLALFFAGQMHVFRPRTDLSKALLAIGPLLGAALIAISRCEDYRHDVYDVTCGSILGMTIAYFSYRRYYPRLHSSKCDEPFPSRESSFNEGFGKIKNDEEIARSGRDFETSDDENGH
jgi:diacylglycerol diphosphate phosphatase/phosphatidate phosphatase